MSNPAENQANQFGSERVLDRDYIELRNRIAFASNIAEEYYTYLDNARNGRAELSSSHMSSYIDRIVTANRSLWKLLKLVPYEHKNQYNIKKRALVKILQEQIATQKQKEELEKPQNSIE